MKLTRTAISTGDLSGTSATSDSNNPADDAGIVWDAGIQIVIDSYSPIVVGRVVGDIDILTSPSLALALVQLAKTETPFVLDLTNVGFVGTSALSVLLDFATTSRYEHISWALAGNRSLLHLLDATNVDADICTCSSVEEATRRIRAS